MCYEGIPVSGNKVADCFANFFEEKVKRLVENVTIDPNVQNGTQKPIMGSGDISMLNCTMS